MRLRGSLGATSIVLGLSIAAASCGDDRTMDLGAPDSASARDLAVRDAGLDDLAVLDASPEAPPADLTMIPDLVFVPPDFAGDLYRPPPDLNGIWRDLQVHDLGGVDQASTDLALGCANLTAGQVYPMAGPALAAAVADVNGDGWVDLEVAPAFAIGVLPGDGTGAFGAPSFFPSSQYSSGLIAADLDGDGIPDLAAAAYLGTEVWISHGWGDGTFDTPALFQTGFAPGDLAVADLDGDGKLDLLVSDNSKARVCAFPGAGNGQFGQPSCAAVKSLVDKITVVDLDRDGKLDLVTSSFSGGINVLRGNGDGTFAAPSYYSNTYDPAEVADLDGDGILDVATAEDVGQLDLFFGKGDGTFGPRQQVQLDPGVWAAAALDLNGDGDPDLAVINQSTSELHLLLGDGGGGFTLRATCSAGFVPKRIQAADLNADGKLDLVIATVDGVRVMLRR